MSETISASAFSGVAHVQHITVAADTMTTTGSPVKMPPGDTVHATARLSCAPDKRFSWPPPANLTLFVLRKLCRLCEICVATDSGSARDLLESGS